MVRAFVGDRVLIRIKEDEIQPAYSMDYSVILQFEIIGERRDLYVVHVLPDVCLKEAFELSTFDCNRYEIPMRFLNEKAHIITTEHMVKVFGRMGPREGAHCARCGEFSSYSEPNQENGTFLCYLCRVWNPYR